jgi:hypothetical protein
MKENKYLKINVEHVFNISNKKKSDFFAYRHEISLVHGRGSSRDLVQYLLSRDIVLG